ncbi:MAG: four helix bundle protein [Patescibacteria group bacterium]|nr:four helix bundle protein [Patescibacteria group bacterium]
MFRFEKLRVWSDTRILVKEVYLLTKKFPNEEKFCLVDQIRRAIISVILNIAEGSDKKSDAEFKRFLRMSVASAEEVVTGFYLALDLNYVNKEEFQNVYTKISFIVAEINALIGKLR